MANTKSAIKNIRKNQRRRVINKSRITALRSQVRKLRSLVGSKNAEEAARQLPRTVSAIDRSIRKGILHRNAAARTKSRLTRAVRSLTPAKA